MITAPANDSLAALITMNGAGAPNQITITVHADAPGIPLSPVMYGIFFEEINHAGDGGIYAEKLRDRKFAEGAAHWKSVGRGKASFLHDVLRLDAGGAVETDGYWGIGVERGKALKFTATVIGGPLRVDLASPTGERIAEAVLNPGSALVLLKPDASVPNARLRISSMGGIVTLTNPSLMPIDTFGNAPLRKDLGDTVAAMKPSFLRFPGGCFVEGASLAEKFNWKKSLGAPEFRSSNRCIWNYEATNGLGFHEYLQWADGLGAEPLFVVNCGMSHTDSVPIEEMHTVIQDTLDAIEYADGDPVTTHWGAMRAKNGHPKPFGLRYIEIGNENGGPLYEERYPLIYHAVKSRYPHVQLIANDWGGIPKSAPVDLVDEHFYGTMDGILRFAERYDSRDRMGPKVYVGEYAVTEGSGTGNMAAALGEAGLMAICERNADIITMTSYAPLLVNAHNRVWNPDAIVFDSSRVYGTPSYWAQRMFSENRGDTVLPVKMEDSRVRPADARLHGKIGIGTWRTSAEFADIRVNGKPTTVSAVDGKWTETTEARYLQQDATANPIATGGDPHAGDMTLTLKARKLTGEEGFLVIFHAGDAKNYLWWNVGGWGNSRSNIELEVNGARGVIAKEVPNHIEPNRWYDLKVVTTGARIQCYLDGELIHDVEMPPLTNDLFAVAARDTRGHALLVKVVNVAGHAVRTGIKLPGAARLTGKGTATVLTSASLYDENSFEAPRHIAPQTQALTGIGSEFNCTLPPYSVTILRLDLVR